MPFCHWSITRHDPVMLVVAVVPGHLDVSRLPERCLGAIRHFQSGRSLWFSAINSVVHSTFAVRPECPLLEAAVGLRSN